METKNKKVLVTGATGRQGGAVARHLLDRGFSVLALTRDPSKMPARELAMRGAELVRGDLNDPASLSRTLSGLYGVFSVQNFWESGAQSEIRQGIDLADIALECGVKHFVYSSVGGADRQSGLPHFESKWEIENHIREIGLPYTILRPVFFMENFENYVRDQILSGKLPQPLDPECALQMICVEDIGGFAAMAFEHPGKWLGKEIELAGDEKTMPQVAQIFTRLLGYTVQYLQVPWEQFRQVAGEETTKMYQWFNDYGYQADISALRREYPQLATLEQTLRNENWQMRMTA